MFVLLWYHGVVYSGNYISGSDILRKLTLVCAVIFFVAVFHISVYGAESENDTIKIGLFYGSGAKDSILIGSESGFYMGLEVQGEFAREAELTEKELTVCASGSNDVSIGVYTYSADLFPTLYPVSGNIIINGTEYRGGVQFKRLDGGKLTVINVVNLEQYLYSVVGKEMSPSWHIEALKAQAICARGFAISNKNKFAKYGFNLDNTTTSQAYQGVSKERESTIRAVEETKGMVLMHDGKIIQSIYCASMGGASANAENVWGGNYPYLVSVKDPYENPEEATRYSWSITLTKDEIKKCLASAKVDIGDITDVRIVSQDEAGYVCELLFEGTTGIHTVKRSNCRGIFGGKLHSQRYTIQGSGPAYENVAVLSAKGISHIPADGVFVRNGGTTPSLYALSAKGGKLFSASSSGTTGADEFTFNGNGWGHGVGMSQWGAKAMADQGFTCDEILTFYYTGTYIEKLY